MEIPLSKIANKARVKQSIVSYKEHIQKKTKSGSLMTRQAHMELIIENNYNASLGETIYYVNNGKTKSVGDVQKLSKPKLVLTSQQTLDFEVNNGKQVPRVETGVKINCYMIPEKEIMDNPNMKGEYNVVRYLSNFNKRIEPLLVVFNPEIRNEILIDKPEKRPFFTRTQCELVNGHPIKEGGQDNYNEVMTLSDSEVIFWNKVQRDPFFMYVDNSLDLIDTEWVEYNRKVLNLQEESVMSNDDEIIETNGNDYSNISIDIKFDKFY